MAPGTEFARDFCAGIGPLQLGVVLVSFIFGLLSVVVFFVVVFLTDYYTHEELVCKQSYTHFYMKIVQSFW